jgi:hypothetical protein
VNYLVLDIIGAVMEMAIFVLLALRCLRLTMDVDDLNARIKIIEHEHGIVSSEDVEINTPAQSGEGEK